VTELQTRKQVVQTALRMNALGVNRGKSGNVSTRWKEGCLITPSGLAYKDTRPSDVVYIDAKGKATGRRAPSSEWRFHHDIYRAHPETGAVVHTHSTFATTLACLNIEVPAFHYMIAVGGGDNIRCAPYATFGTQELSDNALRALSGRRACLLAHHGMIALGADLDAALRLTVEVEALCEQYWRVLQIGKPDILPSEEMAVVLEKFRTYGQTPKGS
jgi:L-fuculose-phosphate aldolase